VTELDAQLARRKLATITRNGGAHAACVIYAAAEILG
jgi:hypothetical protein